MTPTVQGTDPARSAVPGRDRRVRPGSRGRARALLLAALIWLAGAAPAGAAEVDAWDHGPFGRLVLDWGAPVPVAIAEQPDGRITLSADRPVTGGLGVLTDRLGAYLADVALEDEGRRVVLVPTGPLALTEVPFEDGLVLDLRPAPATADAPTAASSETAAPVDTAPPAEAAPTETVRVRGGEHGGFSRVVFDWTAPVTYRTERDGSVLRLVFDRPATADFTLAYPERLARVGTVAQLPDADGMTVAITLPEDARVRFFDSGLKVVVDILGGAPGSAPAELPAALAATEEPAAPAPPDTAASAPEAPATADGTAEAPTASAETAPPAEAATAPPAGAAGAASAPETDAAGADGATGDGPTTATGTAAATDAPDEPAAATPGPDDAGTPTGDAAAAGPGAAAEPDTAAAPAAPPPSVALGAPDAEPDPTPFAAAFDPGRPAALAAFARGGALWVVFSADRPLDVNALLAQGDRAFGPGRVIAADAGAVLMWPLDGALDRGDQPVVDRRGDTWHVALPAAAETAAEPRPVRIERQPDFPLGARLFVDEAGADRVIGVADPRVGDRLLVVPLAEPGVRLDSPRRQVGFELLASGQGLVVRPAADDLAVRPVTGGVEITRPDGLAISPADAAARTTPAALDVGRVFDIPAWRGPDDRFVETRQDLRRAVVQVPDSEIDQARLDLARFYFAHGLGEEVEAMVDLVGRSTPGVADRPEFRALRGATAVLTGDAERARADLAAPELDGDAEIALWRGAAAALAEDWPAARAAFEAAGELISTYPQPFRDRFFVDAMEAAFRGGDAATAAAGLDWLADQTDGASDWQPRVAFLRGEIAEANGRPERAARAYGRAADSNDRLWRTRGELALIRNGLADGTMAAGAATDRLEALRFAWRGDALETEILRTLGDAAWAAGRHADAFGHYEHAASVAPESPEAEAAAALLPARYRELLGGPALDETSPLAAYSVFDSRRDLLPEGEAGDQIVERVAETLAGVDLLDRAAGLMEELAGERLDDPAEVARAGARAAALRLLDDRPEQALTTLDATEPPFAPTLPAPMTAAGLAIDRAAAGAFDGDGAADGAAVTAATGTAVDTPADTGAGDPTTEGAADGTTAATGTGTAETPDETTPGETTAVADADAPPGDDAAGDPLADRLDAAMAEVLDEEQAAALAASIEAVDDGANTGAATPPTGTTDAADVEAASTDASGTGDAAPAGGDGAPSVAAAPVAPVTAADAGSIAAAPGPLAATAPRPVADADGLLAERRLLRARALADLGRPERALDLLSGDTSEVAEAAKLDIAWSNQLWDDAASILERRIGPPPPLGEPVDADTARRVVDLAVAEALADDRAALDQLAIGFGPAMAETEYANTFAVVTRAGGASAPIDDLAAVRRQVEEIETFEAFLDGYRARTTPALIN